MKKIERKGLKESEIEREKEEEGGGGGGGDNASVLFIIAMTLKR